MTLEYIKEQSRLLEEKLLSLQAEKTGMSPAGLSYFQYNLGKISFNNESNVQILHRIMEKSSVKHPSGLCMVDHGAGIGFWGLLAKQCGIGSVICHDISQEMIHDCRLLSEHLGLGFQHYVLGDAVALKDYCADRSIEVDGLASRNVIEHVHDLDEFFDTVGQLPGKNLVMVINTSANMHNPAVKWQHVRIHRFYETKGVHTDMMKGAVDPSLSGMAVRRKIILGLNAEIGEPFLTRLIQNSRGLDVNGIRNMVADFERTGKVPPLREKLSNTMEPYSGTWVERLVPFEVYRQTADRHGFEAESLPGFYNEHYRSAAARTASKILNTVIRFFPVIHRRISPFLSMRFIRRSS